jgi:hypothetical protein
MNNRNILSNLLGTLQLRPSGVPTAQQVMEHIVRSRPNLLSNFVDAYQSKKETTFHQLTDASQAFVLDSWRVFSNAVDAAKLLA